MRELEGSEQRREFRIFRFSDGTQRDKKASKANIKISL
jgi:hypothetical protein